jgi:hypothetical protein
LNLEILKRRSKPVGKRIYEWFLEPNDSHTNEVISRNVGAENIMEDVLCADNQRRNLWRCPSKKVFMLWRSRSDLRIKFRIFSRELPNGGIRDCTIAFKNEPGKKAKKRRKNAKAKTV